MKKGITNFVNRSDFGIQKNLIKTCKGKKFKI